MKHKAITLVLLAVLLSGCANNSNSNENVIQIGGMFGLTGISQQYGHDELRGAQLAIKEINSNGGINGKKLNLIVEDGRTSVEGNLNAYKKLAEVDKVRFIIGPTWTESAHAIVPFIGEDNVILISPTAGEVEHELFNDHNFFKTYPPYRDETKILVEHMQEHNIERISVVLTQGTFENSMLLGFKDNSKSADITIVSEHLVQYGDNDFRSLITKLQQENIDAIYLLHGDYGGLGEFLDQARALGLDTEVYSYSGVEQVSLLNDYGPVLEGMMYPISDMNQQDVNFKEKFKEEYGEEPLTPAAATAYDAVKMLAIGLEYGRDSGEDVNLVRAGMKNIQNYSGASPITGFNENGWPVTTRKYVMKTVRNEEFVEI